MTKVKICGLTRLEDAKLAADLGASAVGFIFFEKSPRYVAPAAVRAIAESLPTRVERVGVFVDPTLEHLASVVREAKLTRVQLHGEESPAMCADAPVPAIKVLRLRADEGFATAVPYRLAVAGFLIDAEAPAGVWGGTGTRVDWTLASLFMAHERAGASAAPLTKARELWLAGGIHAGNAREAIRAVRPDGLDVSSGVESAPGIKDAGKLRELFAAIEREES